MSYGDRELTLASLSGQRGCGRLTTWMGRSQAGTRALSIQGILKQDGTSETFMPRWALLEDQTLLR